ncbi:MAG: glutamyl-tRNA reductase [Gammaproteobacteria bacterium]|nr:glutamyl-tRNA reductase [Gammaproteobacteria bacterium]
MPIIACGINHKTAALDLREQAVFSLDKLALYLSDLLSYDFVREAVILSTCNRSEVYCDADDVEQIIDWFCLQHHLTRDQIEPALYVYRDEEAVQHIMQVACGLDSMILGETQILGQMKDAFSESCASGAVGGLFNRLFQQVFAVAKEVRSNTAIGACPVSVASAAVGLAKQIVTSFNQAAALVIGAGDTVDLVIRHLKAHAIQKIIIINRSFENAKVLAKKHDIEAMIFSDLAKALETVDIVISATSSTSPVVTHKLMSNVMKKRQNKFIAMIDIAVPRDIESAVAELENVSLQCIDDLKRIIQHNLKGREHAAEKARDVIQQKSRDFIAWLSSLDIVSLTIRKYRNQIEDISRLEMIKATKQLERGEDPILVLTNFAYAFTNKLLHSPSVQLRQAGVEGRLDVLQFAQQLFAISESELT